MAVSLKNVHTLRKYLWKGEDNIFLFVAFQHYKEACGAGWSSAKQGDSPFTPASLQHMYGSRRCVSTHSQRGNMRIIFCAFSLKPDVLWAARSLCRYDCKVIQEVFLKLLPRDERVKKNKIASPYNAFYKGSLTPLFWVELKYTYEVNITKITVPQMSVLFQNMQTTYKSPSWVLLLMDNKRKGSNNKMKGEKKKELYQDKCTSISAPEGNSP